MIRRVLVLLLILVINVSCSEKKPNIVLLFVDDLGWSDLGYRNPLLESPNIDELAANSMDFQQAYIPSPTCSPSRSTLLTGKHPARLGIVRHIRHEDKYGRNKEEYHLLSKDPAQFPSKNWLDLEHVTYAEALKEQGYYNYFIGKWHLGHEEFHPIHQGFDQQYGTTNWGHPNSYHPKYFKNTDVLADEKDAYLTDKLTENAVEFIKKYDKNQPFMLSFWYYNVHGPHDGKDENVKYFEAKGLSGRYAKYAAMIKSVDESVGSIRAALEEKGIAENTILLFLSDQGGYFENKPFHGGKRLDALHEGGARVPFMVYWPGVVEKGAQNNSIVQSTDVFPTLIEMAGGKPSVYKKLDGVSLVDVIRNNHTLERGEPIFGYRAYEDQYASVRLGDWKLIAYRSGRTQLYNIAEDISEENDLSELEIEKREELIRKLIDWEQDMGVEQYSGFQD